MLSIFPLETELSSLPDHLSEDEKLCCDELGYQGPFKKSSKSKSDQDQALFDDYFYTMSWLAFPFGDKRKASLSHLLEVRGIPTLVALGPSGKIVTTGVRNLIMCGAKAFPLTEKRMKEINAETAEMVKGWPKKIKHELLLSKRLGYNCDGCSQVGQIWSFYCEECDFDMDPKCTLEEKKESNINPKEDQRCKAQWNRKRMEDGLVMMKFV
ncbi:putative nucleoredoxin 1 [Capsicum baccatum]|uniref:protein-disulfide reductase n=1 Tax=Capsicum baccatum TaxID=33114 RepID=A0A2G2VML0_CAPBA|nr:putative nucleoredoxin 1 [Capsicum baccatum]